MKRDKRAVASDRLSAPGAAAADLAERLSAAEETVAKYRQLTADYPGRYRSELANALTDLSFALMLKQDRPAESADAGQEALAVGLSNLGLRLFHLDRAGDALPFAQAAVTAYRTLAAADPDRFRSNLVGSLSNLCITLAEMGRPAEALAPVEEAVAAYRELAAASPDRYRPGLARALHSLGIWLAERGLHADAVPVDQEAAGAYRKLAAADPARYWPDLAAVLSNLSGELGELGRHAQALMAADESVSMYKKLARASPTWGLAARPTRSAPPGKASPSTGGWPRPAPATTTPLWRTPWTTWRTA